MDAILLKLEKANGIKSVPGLIDALNSTKSLYIYIKKIYLIVFFFY